jgi:hypothetical protein
MMENSMTFYADQDPNTVFELTKESFPIMKRTLAQATPESFARANIIENATSFRIEVNFTEEEALLVRSALLMVKNRFQINPN